MTRVEKFKQILIDRGFDRFKIGESMLGTCLICNKTMLANVKVQLYHEHNIVQVLLHDGIYLYQGSITGGQEKFFNELLDSLKI